MEGSFSPEGVEVNLGNIPKGLKSSPTSEIQPSQPPAVPVTEPPIQLKEPDVSEDPSLDTEKENELKVSQSEKPADEILKDVDNETSPQKHQLIPSDHTALAQQASSTYSEFRQSQGEYAQFQINNSDFRPNESKSPKPLKVAARISRNIARMVGDMSMKRKTEHLDITEKNLEITLNVLKRDDLLDDPRFTVLLEDPQNRVIIANLLNQEIYKEANCTSFLMVEGVSVPQFQALIEEMGYNPRAFLSDDRGENAGRIAIDNALIDSKHPLIEDQKSIPAEEMEYWNKIFEEKPNLLPGFIWKMLGMENWSMSRTHGVVYGVKKNDKDVLLIPVHIDPKNAVAVFAPKKPGERNALDYHQTTAGSSKQYTGTGQYELGCLHLIKLFSQLSQKRSDMRIIVNGIQNLKTTGTISGDDVMTWAINNLAAKSG